MKPIKFAFLIHPRNMDDVKINYPYLRFVPDLILEFAMLFFGPKKIDIITGLKNKDGVKTEGYLVAVFISARGMLLLPRFFVKMRIHQAVKLSKKLGCELVGLGMFTSPLVNGGLELSGKYGIGITNGNALTASISLDGVEEIMIKKNISMSDAVISIIGATGSVGSAISIGLSHKCPKKLVLVGRTPKNLDSLKKQILDNKHTEVIVSTDICDVKTSDIIITATASTKALIKPEHLKSNAIVYDLAQPQNVSEDVKSLRKDVIVIDGGFVEYPEGVEYGFELGLPDKTFFACLSETAVLAIEGIKEDFSIGKVSFKNVSIIKEMAEKNNFRLAKLKN